MKFADAKDIKRARELGNHSSSVNLSRTEIARGKSSAMAQAITDKRKILGRLEAIAGEWTDRKILMPFVEKCISLWPNSIYTQAYWAGERQGRYMNRMRPNWRKEFDRLDLSIDSLRKKGSIESESGKTITGYEYDWDPVGVIIFNTVFGYNL